MRSRTEQNDKSDFGQGSVMSNICRLAGPMIMAQLVSLLYNIIDRMYIGHLPENASLALTGLGLTFPVISMILAFANLFGMGGTPLFSIARGKNQTERAEHIMGNTCSMLIAVGVLLMVFFYLLRRPILYLFGASDSTIDYASDYLGIYLTGTVFVMLTTGMNGFINAQGFATKGMLTVMIGAVCNLILDPLFIFVWGMGVQGAALATVFSQMISCIWAVSFLCGKKTILKIKKEYLKPDPVLIREITALGLSGFVMSFTNSAVQIVCNTTLQSWGGDLYVGVMTVLNSVREIFTMPISGLTTAAQPVMGYNYGARKFDRVRECIKLLTVIGVLYTVVSWIILEIFPEPFIHIFNSEPELMEAGVPAIGIYFFGFFFMALQFAGQSVFVALGKSRQAVFFSLFRKAIIVIPLTLFLPYLADLGVNGVFWAEPVSNFIGGMACYITMIFTVWRQLKREK